MGKEEPNWSFMDTWLDSPYIYDIYDTNDGDSMTAIKNVIYEGWNMTYMKFHVKIEHPRELSCELRKLNGLQLKFEKAEG